MVYINPWKLQPKYNWLHNQCREEPPMSDMAVLIAFTRALGTDCKGDYLREHTQVVECRMQEMCRF